MSNTIIKDLGHCRNCSYTKCLSNRMQINKGAYDPFDIDDYCTKAHIDQYKAEKELIPNIDHIYGDERTIALNIAELKKRVIDRARIVNKYESGEYTKEQYNSRLMGCDIILNMCIDELVKKTNDVRYLDFKVRDTEEVLIDG